MVKVSAYYMVQYGGHSDVFYASQCPLYKAWWSITIASWPKIDEAVTITFFIRLHYSVRMYMYRLFGTLLSRIAIEKSSSSADALLIQSWLL